MTQDTSRDGVTGRDDVVRVQVGGRPVLLRTADVGALVPTQSGYADAGRVTDRVARGVEGLDDLIRGVGTAMRQAAAAVRPDEVTVSFGVELAVKPGAVVSLLAASEAKAALTVTLAWRTGEDGSAEPDPEPEPEPDPDPAQNATPGQGSGPAPGTGTPTGPSTTPGAGS
ncbi:CU044_2847 family protein [Streptomyces sp. cg28]|uniref:CU044_2847 family protein n=1 Tax=Streptomyces sp. cg28 TaxID=3403457 RepID=UPI003B20D4CD